MPGTAFRFTGLVFGLILSASLAVHPAVSSPSPTSDVLPASAAAWPAHAGLTTAHPRTAPRFAQLPLYLVENRGQVDSDVAFYALGGGTAVYFTEDGLTLVLKRSDEGARSRNSANPRELAGEDLPPQPEARWVVKLDFVGANPGVRPVGAQQSAATVSYFKGPPDERRAGLPTFAQVVYPELWPGIDLLYYGEAGTLKYEFRIKPGGDPGQIRLAYRGVEGLSLSAAGQLEVTTPFGALVDDAPVAWQETGGQRAAVESVYELAGLEYGFRTGPYDRTQPLVLDPAVLVYAGFLGGSDYDEGFDIAVDKDGNSYITGSTSSSEDTFPWREGPDSTYNGESDAFVVKVDPTGRNLIYAGYIGGSSRDEGHGIAVDGDGHAYITGNTTSPQATFPVTVGPDLSFNGSTDAFVAKVSADGAALLYAGYIGGSGWEDGNGIAVDRAGSAYLTGRTESTEASFPVKVGPDLTSNGNGDAFVAKVNADGTALVYSGFLGGSSGDQSSGIAADSSGNAYVTGGTSSTEATFPVKAGPDLTQNGDADAFVAKIDATGAALLYAGYIGGADFDGGSRIALDRAGNAYITGVSKSSETTFPVTAGPDLTFNGGWGVYGPADAFVAKITPTGSRLVYAGYIGGAGNDQGRGIAVDDAGRAYVTGYTDSTEATFPVRAGPDLSWNGERDAFVARVEPSAHGLEYAGYIGGSGRDMGAGVALDAAGGAYIAGYTDSTEETFPVGTGPDLTFNGGSDAFVAKVTFDQLTFLPLIMKPR